METRIEQEIARGIAQRIAKGIAIAIAAIIGITIFIFLGGKIVQWLWNGLLPPLFGFPTVTYWQALGLLALSRIMFGSWGGRGGGRRWSRKTRSDSAGACTSAGATDRRRRRQTRRWPGLRPSTRACPAEARSAKAGTSRRRSTYQP